MKRKIIKRIFMRLVLFLCAFGMFSFSSALEEIVELDNGEKIKVIWRNEEQLEWRVEAVKWYGSFEKAKEGFIKNASSEGVEYWSDDASVGCINWAGLVLLDSNEWDDDGGDWGWWTQDTSTDDESPPTVTTSTSYGGSCSSYISSWKKVWHNCIAQYPWSSDGITYCTQKYTWSPIYSSCWTEVCITTTTCDKDWNCSSSTSCSCDTSSCPSDAPRPSDWYVNIGIKVDLNNPISYCQNIFANDYDECSIILKVSWHPNGWKSIVWANSSLTTVSNIKDVSWIKSKVIWSSSYNALDFSSVFSNWIQWNGTNFLIKINWIKAYTPFFTSNWKIKFKLGGTEMTAKNIKYKILKPYIWKLEIIRWDWENDILRIGVQQRYKVTVSKMNINTNITNLNIYNLANSFNVKPENLYKVQETTWEKYISIDSNNWYAIVDATVNYIWNNTMLVVPEVQVKPIISYKINWVPVNYYLSPDIDPLNNTPLSVVWNKFIGVKIVWLSQWHWKQRLTWWPLNSSKILLYSVRNNIRRKALKVISSLKSWEVYNNIKYVEWNIKASDINNDISANKYDTIIIKNWNLIVDTDLNPMWKKLGIIVLRDDPDNLNDFSEWNILIMPNVWFINAVIYADGSLFSVDYNANPLKKDTVKRYTLLKKQLIFKWRLIVRNTIWGAILWSEEKFVLPGGKKLSNSKEDFEKAMIFDLNYIRTGNEWRDKNGNWILDKWEYKAPFVIIYDPKFILNPPHLFEF